MIGLSATLILQGCVVREEDSRVAGGRSWNYAAASALQPGRTSMAEAIALLGQPPDKSSLADGSTVLHWYSVTGKGAADYYASSLTAGFGADGIMREGTGRNALGTIPAPAPLRAPVAPMAAAPAPMAPPPAPEAAPEPPARLGVGGLAGGI